MQQPAVGSKLAMTVCGSNGAPGPDGRGPVPPISRSATWFITATDYALVIEGHAQVRVPKGLRHAKTYGVGETACGLDARGWFKFWDRSFDLSSRDLCPTCALALGLR